MWEIVWAFVRHVPIALRFLIYVVVLYICVVWLRKLLGFLWFRLRKWGSIGLLALYSGGSTVRLAQSRENPARLKDAVAHYEKRALPWSAKLEAMTPKRRRWLSRLLILIMLALCVLVLLPYGALGVADIVYAGISSFEKQLVESSLLVKLGVDQAELQACLYDPWQMEMPVRELVRGEGYETEWPWYLRFLPVRKATWENYTKQYGVWRVLAVEYATGIRCAYQDSDGWAELWRKINNP